MRVAAYALLLVAGLACARRSNAVEGVDDSAASADGSPKIGTRVNRTIERLEERDTLAKRAQERYDAEKGIQTKHEGVHRVLLKAASQRRFGQIWWGARYPHGQKVAPRVVIDSYVVKCSVDASGRATAIDAGSDWTDFETRIDELPSGRYRIIAPLDEATLDVP